MPTRIAFSTTFPDRMGDLAGKFTRFPEKILAGIMMEDGYVKHGIGDCVRVMEAAGYKCDLGIIDNRTHTHLPNGKIVPFTGGELKPNYIPKTTTIRKNYEYWKSKEGQMIQPFFWSGKPRKSKQVVFCPPVLLHSVEPVFIGVLMHAVFIGSNQVKLLMNSEELDEFSRNEGFEDFYQLKRWFNEGVDGALLEFKSVEG